MCVCITTPSLSSVPSWYHHIVSVWFAKYELFETPPLGRFEASKGTCKVLTAFFFPRTNESLFVYVECLFYEQLGIWSPGLQKKENEFTRNYGILFLSHSWTNDWMHMRTPLQSLSLFLSLGNSLGNSCYSLVCLYLAQQGRACANMHVC